MVQIKYIRKGGLVIPRLKSRPMGVTFPLMDYKAGKPLPDTAQVIDVLENEANDLIRQGHFVLVESKKAKRGEIKEVVDNA